MRPDHQHPLHAPQPAQAARDRHKPVLGRHVALRGRGARQAEHEDERAELPSKPATARSRSVKGKRHCLHGPPNYPGPVRRESGRVAARVLLQTEFEA